LDSWTDGISYSLSKRRRWELPDRLDQLFSQQLEELQQEPYHVLALTSQDHNLYREKYFATSTGVKALYQNQSEQPIFKGIAVYRCW
jgi:hypothetical protein